MPKIKNYFTMNKEENNALPRLTNSKESFKKEVEERIEKGKELSNFEVKIIRREPSRYNFSGYSDIYDEKTKQEFISLYTKWEAYNIELLNRSFDIPENEYVSSYKSFTSNRFFFTNVVDGLKNNIDKQITFLESIIERLDLIPTKEEGKTNNEMKAINTNKIFIVHGHNETIKEKVARLLENLKLEPIILHEQTDKGMTIIEKFEQHSNDVNFAIILLTADDEGKAKKEKGYKPRARQNVIFEMGYFFAKLERKNVFLLKENEVENPSDLSGIIYTPYDDQGAWRYSLVKQLRELGYNISADNIS